MKKYRVFLFTVLFILIQTASAQTPMGGLIEAADRIAADIPRLLDTPGGPPDELRLGDILFDTAAVQLGSLFADLIANRLTRGADFEPAVVKRRDFSPSPDPPAAPDNPSFRLLSGSIYPVGADYLLVMRLTDPEDRQIRGWEFALESRGITEYLHAPGRMNSGMLPGRFEPNDEPGEAAILNLPFDEEGLFLAGGDEDWFALDVSPGHVESGLFLEAATTGVFDTRLELYAPGQPEWVRAANDDTEELNALIRHPLTESGTWYLKAAGYASNSSGYYGLKAALAQGDPAPGEPDEAPSLAADLPLGTAGLEKRIDYVGDIDWFRIELPRALKSSELLRIETAGAEDTLLELRNRRGRLITADDDSGYEYNAMVAAGGLEAGDFYVTAAAYGGETGPYTVSAKITVPVRDAFESDDSRASASFFDVNDADLRPRRRSFFPMGDIDWVRFIVEERGYYRMTTEGAVDTTMELYDEKGNPVEENDDDGEGYNAAIERLLDAGTWYLKILPYGGTVPEGFYTLSVKRSGGTGGGPPLKSRGEM